LEVVEAAEYRKNRLGKDGFEESGSTCSMENLDEEEKQRRRRTTRRSGVLGMLSRKTETTTMANAKKMNPYISKKVVVAPALPTGERLK